MSENEDSTTAAPPEASNPSLSSDAKDAFFANEPERPKHRSYDVKARNSTDDDANFHAEESSE